MMAVHARTVLALAAGALLVAAPAASGAQVSFTVTGSQGRDEVTAENRSDDRPTMLFRGVSSVAISDPARANCTTETDVLTGRTTAVRCSSNSTVAVVADLRGADDSILVDTSSQGVAVESITLAGGPGNDVISTNGPGALALRGGDGDDTLSSRGQIDQPVTFDGGAGRDLVDFVGGQAPGGSVPGGVTASLATNVSTELYGRHPTFGDFARQGTLIGIERLSGTAQGDRLSGGASGDELIGEAGPDNLEGADGNDALFGGDGEDALNGALGTDSLDGGKGIDEFRANLGGDTIQARDGFAERTACSARETVINDLVDAVDNAAACASVSTAAAKHRFDTVLQRRRLRIAARRRVGVRVACPESKPDRCAGILRLRRGGPRGRVLDSERYRLRPGGSRRLRLRLGAREAAAVRGARATLDATEVDGDGRDRRVIRRTAVR